MGTVQSALDAKFAFAVTTAEMYAIWARKSGADVLTDELSEGATLHWIGPRQKDRVFLFLHGTPFFPTSPIWVGDVDRRGTTRGTVQVEVISLRLGMTTFTCSRPFIRSTKEPSELPCSTIVTSFSNV